MSFTKFDMTDYVNMSVFEDIDLSDYLSTDTFEDDILEEAEAREASRAVSTTCMSSSIPG